MSFGDRLKKLRLENDLTMDEFVEAFNRKYPENGMTQKELAKRIGISQNYLSNLENGKFDIKLSLLFKIALELDIGLQELIEIL